MKLNKTQHFVWGCVKLWVIIMMCLILTGCWQRGNYLDRDQCYELCQEVDMEMTTSGANTLVDNNLLKCKCEITLPRNYTKGLNYGNR